MLKDFIAKLEGQVKNHSIYVWGGQGEKSPKITEKWIRSRETSTTDADRAIRFWKKQVAAGYGEKLRAFDCSGLGVWTLMELGLIKGDTNANGLMKKCDKITRTALKKGDWVFRVYTSGDKKGAAYHIGYVVDDKLNVIEAKGRDDGVVKRGLCASGTAYWNAYGRPSYFKAEIETAKSEKVKAKEKRTVRVKATKKISKIYDKNGNAEKGRFIAKGDICDITAELASGLLIEVVYPTAKGKRTAYIKALENFKEEK